MTTALYTRISRDLAGEGLGVDRQEASCREHADRLGLTDVVLYQDNSASAYSGKVRPEYRRMLADMDAGRVTAVVAWATDRLHRSPIELEEYATVSERHAIPTHTVQAGHLDLTNASGRMVARIVGATARFESEHKAERLKAKHAQLRESGAMVGCPAFGWQTTADGKLSGDLEPVEAGMLRDAAMALLSGGSLFKIAARWNEDGWTTRRGGNWTHSNLRLALCNPRMAGLRAHKRQVVTDPHGEPVRGLWEPILTVEEWQKVCAVVESKRSHRSGANKHILGGLIVCGNCDEGVMYGSQNHGFVMYSCRNCRSAIRDDKVWPTVLSEVTLYSLLDDEPTDSGEGPQEAHSARLTALREADGRLVDAVMDGTLNNAEVASRRAAIREEIADIERHVQSSVASTTVSQSVAAIRAELLVESHCGDDGLDRLTGGLEQMKRAIEHLDFDRRRSLIKGTVKIKVMPGRKPDRVRVEPV